MPKVRWKSIFTDKNGNVVIAQKPNLPIIVWFFSFLLAKLAINPLVAELAQYISFGALFTWAWLELFEGANVFRRILGAAVIAILLYLNLH